MPDSQIAEAIGYANVEELYASELWKMWKDENHGDAYWLQVLAAVQSGDRLSASERVGGLLFQVVDGRMRIFGENGATSTNLWDWQGAGFYTIDRPGSDDRTDAVFSDAMFATTSDYSDPFYSLKSIPQYQYSVNAISVSLVGFGILERRPQFQFSGICDVLGTSGPAVDYFIDVGLTAGGLMVSPAGGLGIALAVIGVTKIAVDGTISVYKTFADPVYAYKYQ